MILLNLLPIDSTGRFYWFWGVAVVVGIAVVWCYSGGSNGGQWRPHRKLILPINKRILLSESSRPWLALPLCSGGRNGSLPLILWYWPFPFHSESRTPFLKKLLVVLLFAIEKIFTCNLWGPWRRCNVIVFKLLDYSTRMSAIDEPTSLIPYRHHISHQTLCPIPLM